MEKAKKKKTTLYEDLLQAYEDDDFAQARNLMCGYSPAKMRVAYKVIKELLGYEAYCAAKRGEWTSLNQFLGI